ncbi:hypothetical protein DUI87_18316 [Hirundo rustica rustica]|uniref:PH domain-containing protein n=1 Tax=Hirundo rustica rustica TaxID=333673 RepID=A0A3M0K1K2_HIRRU|nr:hypothetical protein DUI87_18316 [Hirundo rustica rustica]
MSDATGVPEDVCSLLADIETFVSQTLKGENLSKKAKERREVLLKQIKDIKASYPEEFPEEEREDEEESENPHSSPPDSVSIASDRYDKEDEAPSDVNQEKSDNVHNLNNEWLENADARVDLIEGSKPAQSFTLQVLLFNSDAFTFLYLRRNQFPPVAAQDLQFVLKAGYLEKRRKDHAFLGFEWQKRWCAISKTVFYYYGSDKDKQQKGEFALEGYTIRMNNSLRKDAKKDCCFEISAPDKRIYQFTAATPKEAEEWVQQVKFVIQDTGSNTIPEEEEEEYDDVGQVNSEPIDDSIYEEVKEKNYYYQVFLHEELKSDSDGVKKIYSGETGINYFKEERLSSKAEVLSNESQEEVTTVSDSKNTDYANFYQGLWDCTGDEADELTFKRGDIIYIISKIKGLFIILSVLLKYSRLPMLAVILRAECSEGYQMVNPVVPEI